MSPVRPRWGIDRSLAVRASAHQAHKLPLRFRQVRRTFARRDPFLASPPWAPYRSAAYPLFAAEQPMNPLIEDYRRFRYEAFPLEIQRAP
jgi:hypothetical protein